MADDSTTLAGYQKQLARQSSSPAAPAGLQQQATAAQGDLTLAGYIQQEGYQPMAQSWYTGANQEGTNNGWDNQFTQDFIEGQNKAAEKGNLNTYFEQKNATGVVTWDHSSTDGATEFKFGDIYQGGKKVGNVYKQFDEPTADLMMADWLFDGTTKAEIFGASDNVERLRREVESKRESNNIEIPKAMAAQEFQGDVQERAEGFQEGVVDESIVAGAAAGGAALGAGAGAAFFGVGAVPGAILGGAIGAGTGLIGGYLNKDALTEQAARAYEITSMSSRENGTAAGIATGVSQWAGFGGKLIVPAQNLVQGAYDATAGEVGDGKSEFYRVDKQGDSDVPAWMKVADVAAAVGDAGLQFATPIGLGLYTAQMGGYIGGEVGELALTGGKSFDYTAGGFDSIFTDDKGDFSFTQAAAGIGKVGIDVVQLGFARGLAGKVDSALVRTGQSEAYGVGKYLQPFRSAAGKDALAAGGKEEVVAGFRIVTDSAGKVVSQRPALSLLAPSEQLQALSSRLIGMRQAAVKGGSYTADDFYRAALAMSTGERKIQTALVNGFGEASEEAIQQVLDPYSHQAAISAQDIGQSALYGFAMGAGMGLGMGARQPTMDAKMYAQARAAHYTATGGADLSPADWNAKNDMEKRSLAAMGNMQLETVKAAYTKIAEDQAAGMTAQVVGVSKLMDAVQSVLKQNLSSSTDRTDGAFVIVPLEDAAHPSDAVTSSGAQLARNHENRQRGVDAQRVTVDRQLAQVIAQLEADPTNEELLARRAELQSTSDRLDLMMRWGQVMMEELTPRIERMYSPDASGETIAAEAAALNDLLAQAFNRQLNSIGGAALTDEDKMALARTVSQITTRDPQDANRSFQVLLPQVDTTLTMWKSDNVLGVSQAILPAIRGDYDGDKVRDLNQLMLDDAAYTAARSGAQFIGAGGKVNVGTPKSEAWVIDYLSQALRSGSTGLANEATFVMTSIGDTLRARYQDAVDPKVLDEVLAAFNQVLHSGEGDARAALLDGLADKAGGQITEYARGNLSNEWLFVSRLVQQHLQGFQEIYAAHTTGDGELNTTKAPVNQQSTQVKEVRALAAATTGNTLALQTVGDSMFRKFQKLHYSLLSSTSDTAVPSGEQMTLEEMALLYETLGQGMTRSALEEVRGKDDITARVFVQLQRLANDAKSLNPQLNTVQAMTVLANIRVQDVDTAEDGTITSNGKEITLAQMLLKKSVEKDMREKDAILESSPELQAKHRRLKAMYSAPAQGRPGSSKVNAEKTFVEIFGSQQLYTLLGEAAQVFGPHLTVEQYVRFYVSRSESQRRELALQLKGQPEYLGRNEKHNVPYDLDEMQGPNTITAYRSVVDSLLAAGNDRISMNEDGTLHGEFAKKSRGTSETFLTAHRQVRQALLEFAGLQPGNETGLNAELIQRMLESNPDIARRVMALIPNSAANVVFQVRDENVFIANWVYDTFALESAQEAEMHYYRNLLVAEWRSKGVDALLREKENDGEAKRQYSEMTRRMHRVWWRLAALNDGGLLLQKFISELESASSVDEFVKWVNTTPGIRGDQAPLTAWVDDVAEFDMDKAQGGWTTSLQGSERREAIASLQRGADQLVHDISEERLAVEEDVSVLQAVSRHAKVVAGDEGATPKQGDRALYEQLAKAIDEAGERYTGLGPQSMIYQTIAAVRGFYPQAHAKGKNPDHLDAAGAIDAQRDAYDYTTNYERVMAALTTQNIDAVGGSLDLVAKDDVRTMDDNGVPVEWTKPTVEQMSELLRNPETRPFARAILFPQVMERDFDGVLRPKMLVGKSLRSLLNGSTHNELFPKHDRLSQDSAFRYLAAVEAQARKYDGHFSVQRAVNDIVVARINAADHVLSTAEIERMTAKVYMEVAQIGQAVGSIGAVPVGEDPLTSLLAQTKKAQRLRATGKLLDLEAADVDTVTDIVLDSLINNRKEEAVRIKEGLLQQTGETADAAEVERLAQQVDSVDADVAQFEEKIRLLASDDFVGQVVQMFTIPENAVDGAAAKSKLIKYVSAHLSMMERSSSNLLLLRKITSQLQDSSYNGQIQLSDKEWRALSNTVIAVYIDEVVSVSAANVSVPPFPDAEFATNQRYYDTSFGYLAEPLLDPASPLVRAFRDINVRAGRHAVVATDAEIVSVLDRTLFSDYSLGNWTGDIPRASIEANEMLDSASAAPAIAMAGNTPKRQAAISAATRRTYALPDEALLSRASLSWTDLNREDYDDITITHPTGEVARPLLQLNNRFVKSVLVTYTDMEGQQQQLDLLAEDSNLGRTFYGNDAAVAAPYQEIHVERLRNAVVRAMNTRDIPVMGVQVDVELFHPDMQPAQGFYNNLFFEGTSFKLDADTAQSLNATLYFAEGAINPEAQGAALDSRKLGVPGLKVIEAPDAETTKAIEENWLVDFGGMLRAKTRTLLETDMGFGKLEAEFYNATYKNMKMRHYVDGTRDGQTVRLTAEEVMEFQRLNPGEPLPIENARLWIPSDDVLRSMLGEQGTQGVARILNTDLEIDLSAVPTYSGITEQMLQQFPVTERRVELADTRIANLARQQQLQLRTMLTDAERNAYDTRLKYFDELRTNGLIDRSEIPNFNAETNLDRARKAGKKMLKAEDINVDFAAGGVQFIGPRDGGARQQSVRVLEELVASLQSTQSATGWVYSESAESNPPHGLLTKTSLTAQTRPGRQVLPGDLVVMELDSFKGDSELAKKRVDYMVGRGATIVLGAADGSNDLRAELADYLQGQTYESVAGSNTAFQPADTSVRYQNQRARASTLTETRGVSTRSKVAVFSVPDKNIEENGARVAPQNERLTAINVPLDLVPVDFLAGFNVPVSLSQVTDVRLHLQGMDNAEGRGLLRAQAGAESDVEFDKAFTRLLQRFDDNPGTVLPTEGDQFGTGDFIPLVDGQGRVLLYRHGYQAPDRLAVDEMTSMALPNRYDAMNVAVYPNKTEPLATTHTGTVVRFNPRSGYGLSVELNVDLQQFGDKKVLEWNGMKYLLAPMGDDIKLPDHGFFANGWGVDLIASLHDMLSKESFDGLINNHRNAFAFFGIDFLPDVAKFFNTDLRSARELLHQISIGGPSLTITEANEINSAGALTQTLLLQLPEFAAQHAELADAAWLPKLAQQATPEAQITAAMIVYLLTPGAHVQSVLQSGGFNDDSTSIDAQSILMPRLFTQVFDNAELGSELRTEINRRLNEQIDNPSAGGTGYLLHQDFTFEVRNEDPKDNMKGLLQFAEAHSSGDNPVMNGMAFDPSEKSAFSQHSADLAYQALGGADTAYKYDPVKARNFLAGEGVERFDKDLNDGGVWRMLTGIDHTDRSAGKIFRADTPLEAEYRNRAHELVVQYRQAIDTADENGWSETQRKQYRDKKLQIVRMLGLQDSQVEVVDFWARQTHGRPASRNEAEQGELSGKAALAAADDIFANVESGYLPTLGAEVPLLHVHDLQLIYRENLSKKKWAPRESMAGSSTKATSWNEWVEVSLGSALTSDNLFDPLFRHSLDGFMNTYQNALKSLMDLPVSMDTLVSQELLNPENNRMLVSLDPGQDIIASEQIMLDTMRAGLDELIGGQRIAGKFEGREAPASEVAKRRDARRKWRKENGVPLPVDVSMKNFRKNGSQFVEVSTTTNALARMMINLRVGTALLNPALYISMGPEQWVRGTLDRFANLLTGQSTAGITGKLAAKTGASIFSVDQLNKLNKLYDTLGHRSDFKGMVYRDLMFLRPYEPGIGRLERGLEAYAKIGARAQDPTWGMPGKTLARRYMEAAMQHINATPTLTVLSTDKLIAEMAVDPLFLQKNYPEAHQYASNAIAQLRSLKATPLSLMLRGIYEPLSESSHAGRNFFGNVVLKMPLLFSTYGMNVLTTITGMQGYSDMYAAFTHGRKKGPNSILGRAQAAMRGEAFNPEKDALVDMSSVIEGIDLTRTFIRGGLTHTGLFAFGMLAGGLGLSGEDDESKKRRKMSALQGAGYVYDPRLLENDFRNADAIFLDWLPPQISSMFRVVDENAPGGSRSMAQMNWVMKQFVSPIIGMEKFFETGDFRQVTWGFQDAVGAFPLINTMMWDDAVATAHELTKLADDEQKLGDASNLSNSTWFLTNAVGVYERMLFENSFVNQLYASFDRYDRDPYVLPLRDSDGTIQKDIEGNARPNDVALEQYIDPETGQIMEGYQGRDSASATLHALTENRATMAFAASMFTGLGDSDYIRYNMPEKLRQFELPEMTQPEAEAIIRAASQGQGGQVNFSLEEITSVLKAQYLKVENWDGYNQVDREAAAIFKAQNGAVNPMSVLDAAGREVLTEDGSWAVMRGLAKGSVQLGDASLAGIYIPFEMREKIQAEWMKDLVQEGVDLGLDQTKATQRMKRLWYGPIDDPSVQGLGDLLWSKDISYSDKLTYKQLNTTYIQGPDGKPWATGFTRGDVFSALGLNPVKKAYLSEQSATSTDDRLNTTDLVNGINTGLRALELVNESSYIPTDKEIGDSIVKAIEDAAKSDYTPFTPYASSNGSGGYYSSGGYGGYGGGGYSSGGGSAYFSRMYALPGGASPYANSIPVINASTPYVRRASVRRERVWSERGRLKQWQ